jgi:uroporphyrinogen decarboxylase
VSDAEQQVRAALALHERYQSPFLLTAMDLSAEAETFGCTIRMSQHEIPTVMGRRITADEQIEDLPIPQPGACRTAVHLEAARKLVRENIAPVMGGMIGPFSLAGRIYGVNEIMALTINNELLTIKLLEKVTSFLVEYAKAFRATGATGLIIAEPLAGLLSPRSLAKYSAPFVRRIIETVQTEGFTVVLHNCGARNVHLSAILESGADVYHFGAPMDLPAALSAVNSDTILCGNLDPTAVFFTGTPQSVESATRDLIAKCSIHRNFVISSGCDLPPGTPLENLEAFFTSVRQIGMKGEK